jgi:serine/threonine-protein kinase
VSHRSEDHLGLESRAVPDPSPAQPTFEPASLVGTTLDGRYVITGHLASGGMGAIFRAHHVHLRKDFAVKVLRPDLTSSPDIVERFRREAEIASALEHDNIVKVTDFGRTEDGFLFLVMELLTGESLFERLRREAFLPPEEAVIVLWQICAGLEVAHARGVIHRDLKPENVFLARTGSGREVTKILDFGIAKIADPSSGSATQAGIVVGTPEYLSPEQAMGTAVDARADLYAVGLIAWRTLAGRHPFKADDPRSLLMMQATRPVPPLTDVRPDLASYPALVATVAKACAKEPSARHVSAAALRDELAASLGPAFAMPPGATPAPRGPLTPLPVPELQLTPAPVERPVYSSGPFVATTPTRDVPAPAPSTPAPPAPLAELRRSGQFALSLVRRVADTAAATPSRIRDRPLPWGLGAVAALVVAVSVALFVWSHGKPAADARGLLSRERWHEARAVLDAALEERPEDPELLLLRARALHRLPGRATEAVDAYAAARARGPLDAVALGDLVQDLGRERSLADKASRLLKDEGDRALPLLVRAAAAGPGAQRLRALTLLRDLGAEGRVDRVDVYGALLGDPDCELRRAAARRLGEIGDPAALPALRKAAAVREGKGPGKHPPACGAADADAAARRVEAARLPATAK